MAQAPVVSVPKGGGAVRGIGEKFSTNPATGTSGLSIPLPLSPGRSNFTPALSLSYDSGAGYGAFGLGWSLGLPEVSRKTDKGVPTYDDRDVFILSGAEDLVPILGSNGIPKVTPRTVGTHGYSVVRYRPRVEGLHARIERWTRDDGEVHWRSISRDNVTTLYGSSANSRISEPGEPARVFTWLISGSYDDKGNAVGYTYAEENWAEIDQSAAHEQHRPKDVLPANRYLKSVRYGNRHSHLTHASLPPDTWMFELLFDYGEHDGEHPTPADSGTWICRRDPFSSYRAGFEVRTYRLCQRILMFHHFLKENNVGKNCLVRSLALRYRQDPGTAADSNRGEPTGAVLTSLTLTGHRRVTQGGVTGYASQSLPPLELEYSEAAIDSEVRTLDAASLENLPVGIDEGDYRLVDLDGESISGVLSEQADEWYYKPALAGAQFGAVQTLATRPSIPLRAPGSQLVDIAGDGQLDLVNFTGPTPGFFERMDGGWATLRSFTSLPQLDWENPNLRLVDLTGDGHADILATEGDHLVWHPSLAEEGFGPAVHAWVPPDEERGPRLLFADGTGSVFLADLSGDGLTDLVRIRNGEICYWPSLGWGRFGRQVVMDDSPVFDRPDQFDPGRLRLTDIDGTGPTDLIYLGADHVDVYRNRMGNGWAPRQQLAHFPPMDNVAAITVADLFGRGTPCLVWSSPLPRDAGRQLRFVDLMGRKPRLLTRVRNNFGAETVVQYSTSTAFYLADKAAGKPWVTRLPFPVHVVDKVETYDHVNRTRFVSRYRYHHGRFDGVEREFAGFGMVEQEDTEQLAALVDSDPLPTGDNCDAASHVPPVLTRTWFHTGAYLDRERISTVLAHGYYPPPEHAIPEALAWRLGDSVLDGVTSLEGEREACRALKGRPLREEMYARDGSADEPHPYQVVEHNYTVRQLQAAGNGRHGVFTVVPRESVTATCERNPGDARVGHQVVLDVDPYGNVRHSVTLAYRRGSVPTDLPERSRAVQGRTLVTETRAEVTTVVDRDRDDTVPPAPADVDAYRVPVRYAITIRQVTGSGIDDASARLEPDQVRRLLNDPGRTFTVLGRQRIRFADDTAPHRPLTFGVMGALGLVHESYTLVLPDGLVDSVYGNRIADSDLEAAGYVAADGGWWAPSGTVRYTPRGVTAPKAVIDHAREHFFLPRRFVDQFAANAGQEYGTSVEYDEYDLLPLDSTDAAGNRTTAGERDSADTRTGVRMNYRILAPEVVTDPNRNRLAASFDTLGRVAQTSVMGKPEDDTGDRVDASSVDLDVATLTAFWAAPRSKSAALVGTATTRFVYDTDAYWRTRSQPSPQPASVAALARERHVNQGSGQNLIQVSLSYADGMSREIQKKIQAAPAAVEPGPPPAPDRWVASGWVVLNNKGKPIRQYEPFFTATHAFEFAVKVGVSPVLCYDPMQRVVATLHPNHTYEKVVPGPWEQTAWDVNDTVTVADPRKDPDVGPRLAPLPAGDILPTWYQRRGPTSELGQHEIDAATRAAVHAGTPARTVVDPLGRPVLTIAWNRTPADGGGTDRDGWHRTYSVLDVLGNQLAVMDCPSDAAGSVLASGDRLVARYTNDLTGRRLLDESMEAGYRRVLYDIAGQPVSVWRPLAVRNPLQPEAEDRMDTTFDHLRRPVDTILIRGGRQWVVERRTYGEGASGAALRNLRGQVWELRDEAGLVVSRYDVKGNVTAASRTFTAGYRDVVHWNAAVALEMETWTGQSFYDALNRPMEQRQPDTTVVRYTYDIGGRLARITADVPGQPKDAALVRSIRYDAYGRRTSIEYRNDVRTSYEYDSETFRLLRILTLRAKTFMQDDPVPPDTRRGVQDVRYTYDPAGNITNITDAAQPRVFNLNTVVDASTDYVYDALYRLVEARGREHLGLRPDAALRAPTAASWNDAPRVNPADRNALGRYTERYVYDTAGNLTLLRHSGSTAARAGWRRAFRHEAACQLPQATAGQRSNRLTSSTTRTTGRPDAVETYGYDTRGNMTVLPPLQSIAWDFRDELAATSRQVDTTGVPETTYYVYDSVGKRVRKVTDAQSATPQRKSQRHYLGDFELYREFDGNGAVTLARTTVHVMDGEQRTALIETRTDGPNNSPITRYQVTNRLGSAVAELDGFGEWISYEEYYPYGCTALSFARAGTPPKRYRYTTKERDQETGLTYHGARYYAPWLCRWTRSDPGGGIDGSNLYCYASGNPIAFGDPGGMQTLPGPVGSPAHSGLPALNGTAREQAELQSIPEEHASAEGQASGVATDAAWWRFTEPGFQFRGLFVPERTPFESGNIAANIGINFVRTLYNATGMIGNSAVAVQELIQLRDALPLLALEAGLRRVGGSDADIAVLQLGIGMLGSADAASALATGRATAGAGNAFRSSVVEQLVADEATNVLARTSAAARESAELILATKPRSPFEFGHNVAGARIGSRAELFHRVHTGKLSEKPMIKFIQTIKGGFGSEVQQVDAVKLLVNARRMGYSSVRPVPTSAENAARAIAHGRVMSSYPELGGNFYLMARDCTALSRDILSAGGLEPAPWARSPLALDWWMGR